MMKVNGPKRGSGARRCHSKSVKIGAVAALALLAGSSAAFGQGNYLLLAADSATNAEAIRTSLLGTGLVTSVTVMAASGVATPTIQELMQYDAVLTYSNLSYADGAAMGDVLADYVDAGGGVVCAVYVVSTTTANRSLTGRWETGGYDIIPQRSGNTSTAAALGTVHLPGHPLWNGMSTFEGDTTPARAVTLDIAPHGIRVADWNTGGVLAATSSTWGNRVDLNFYPVEYHDDPDGARLLANALVAAAIGGSNDPGGCCFPDGSCQIVTGSDCITQGGNFRGPNTDCVDPCPQPGACCFPDGTCDFTLEVNCTAGGGTYAGAGVTCAQANCPQPPVGACCFGDGTCQIVWEPGCLSQGGNYQGDGTDCATITCPLNITTSFAGTSSTTGAGAGAYFRVTALDPQGLVIDSFDINSAAAAGTAITAHVYAKPGDFEGFETDPNAWILLGEVATIAAGVGNPTPVPIGGLHILNGETWSLRVGAANGGIRYTGSTTPPTFANSQVQLDMGKVQTGLFTGSLFGTSTSLRGWDGRMWYSVGANVTTGACCLPDGTCDTIREIFCDAAGGVYSGDGTDCATIPPCPVGACCFIDGTCSILAESGCTAAGGTYAGTGTDCATANCPQPGACCIPSGCIVLSEGECTALSGEFRGGGTDCATANCPPPTVANIIGFNFTTATATAPDPQNWNRISSPTGSLANVQDDQGIVTPVGIEWSGGVSGNGFLYLATATLAPDAVPQHTYDLSGMTGYGYRSLAAEHTLILNGLTPGAEYQYWFVAYRAVAAIENVIQVSEGDTINAISFPQSITAAANNGRFIVNETIADNTMHWDTLAKSTTSSSTGTLTINWAGNGQTPVIGAFAIREVLSAECYANCDGSTVEPILNVDDFTCFINEFASAQSLPHEQQVTSYPNCDGSTVAPALNVDDFTCFINEFAAGCP